MLYNQSRGGLYKGDMPIFYYHYIERIFDKLETIYKQKNEGGDNTKSGDIPLDLMDVLFATALAISPSESLIKRATGIFDVALLLTDDNDLVTMKMIILIMIIMKMILMVELMRESMWKIFL